MNRDIDPSDPLADCQHISGGWWGNHLEFVDGAPPFTKDTVVGDLRNLRIWGHQPAEARVKTGDLVTVEYGLYWVTFLVTSVEYKSDPPDMFFGNCDLVRICDKKTGEGVWVREETSNLHLPVGWISRLWRMMRGSDDKAA